MAVKSVHYGEIVEVTFKFPGEGYKVHPALVISGKNLDKTISWSTFGAKPKIF
jgi:hypothetical protein